MIAPEVVEAIASAPVEVVRRPFRAEDLDGAWYVVAAAPPDVNRAVAAAAHAAEAVRECRRRLENASAYARSGVAAGGRDDRAVHRWRGAGARGPDARSVGRRAAGRFGGVDGNRATRRDSSGWPTAFRWSSGGRCCWRRWKTLRERSAAQLPPRNANFDEPASRTDKRGAHGAPAGAERGEGAPRATAMGRPGGEAPRLGER